MGVVHDELRSEAEAWLEADPDETTRAELAAILARQDWQELVERFGQKLSFGTAGLRALLGGGPNRMNRAVVMRASLGLVRHVLTEVRDAAERGIVVGYDARRGSRTFAEDAASVFAAAGVRVHWFADVVSTPVTAFAVTHCGAAAGVMVTASHNPADYNGYKVYWSNGAQIVPPHDEHIARAIDAAPPANLIARMALGIARTNGLVRSIAGELEESYLKGIGKLLLARDVRPPLRIVYTPLHGVGFAIAERAFTAAGFTAVSSVPEQTLPDAAFPTVPFPNPEEKGVLDLAIGLARKEGADLVLANDPDADRLAVAVKDEAGVFVQLSGNQVGVVLAHYLLTEDARRDARAVLTTIVSSPMLGEIARQLGVHYEETLTGFKWIATRAIELEALGTRFVFGYEEALGYTAGALVRDKDGVSAAVLFAELTAVCLARGTSVLAYLADLYRRFGFYGSMQRSIALEGTRGAARIAAIMAELRGHPPRAIAGRQVLEQRDYATSLRIFADGRQDRLSLPKSNVVAYELAQGTRLIIRPSGTEPKLKYYLDHREAVTPEEPLASAELRARRTLEAVDVAVVAILERA